MIAGQGVTKSSSNSVEKLDGSKSISVRSGPSGCHDGAKAPTQKTFQNETHWESQLLFRYKLQESPVTLPAELFTLPGKLRWWMRGNVDRGGEAKRNLFEILVSRLARDR